MAESKTGESGSNAGCLCGKVRLRIGGGPEGVLICHCRECQKSSGGGPVLLALFAEDDFEVVAGVPRGFAVTAASGHPVRRMFCADCGTPLFSKPERYPGLVVVKTGAWDTEPGWQPASAIWTASAPDWHRVPEGIACFPRGNS